MWNTCTCNKRKNFFFFPEAPYVPLGLKALYIHYCAMPTGTIRQLGEKCSDGGGYLCLYVWRTMP